jgi:hypothetical protein
MKANQDVVQSNDKFPGGAPSPRQDVGVLPEQTPGFKRAAVKSSDAHNINLPKGLKGLKKPTIFKTLNIPVEQGLISHSKESSESWDVAQGQALPPFPIGRTYTVDLPPSEVCKHIAEGMRKNSVYANYDSDRAEAMCSTSCGCAFKVTLFDAGNPSKTSIEVMRRRGCGLSFSRIQRAVIRFATGNHEVEKAPCMTIPAEISDQYVPPGQDYLEKILDDSSIELQQNDQSAQLGALRLLATVTDETKSHKGSSEKLAEMIMDGYKGIREICINLLSSDGKDDFTFMIKRSVLTIIRNSLCLLVGLNANQTFADDEWYRVSLYPVLMYEIKDCPCPHECALVAQCMFLLLSQSVVLREEAIGGGELKTILNGALERGKKMHKNLEVNAERVLNVLEPV